MTLNAQPAGPQASELDAPALFTTEWRGRTAALLANDLVRCSVLRDGGLLAEFAFTGSDHRRLQNALWEAPWWEGQPHRLDSELCEKYGDVGTGRFLDNYTGHALCLDSFGPPSQAEVMAGSGLHGEASIVPWQLKLQSGLRLEASAHLPFANLTIERLFNLSVGETVLCVDERVTNHNREPRPLHWVQHATVGPPMFSETSIVTTSAREGITWPLSYGDAGLLAKCAEFVWPHAPLLAGNSTDLRRMFAHPHAGFVVAVRQPRDRKYGFVAVSDESQEVTLIYVFATDSFPWVTFWEENRCRHESPWLGRAQARGLEFGTTPLPLGKAAIDHAGPVLGTPTARVAQPGETLRAPWLVAIARMPSIWDPIVDVIVEPNRLVLCNGAQSFHIAAEGAVEFLEVTGEMR
jgi:hypothetical protein